MKLFSDEFILNLYARYKNNSKIMWKYSIKKVLKKYEIEIENDNLRAQILSDYESVAGMDYHLKKQILFSGRTKRNGFL